MRTGTPTRQRGASLLVSLIFLVVMAMLGVTVASVTTMEERMAGHTRDRDLALQAAEAALRNAELKLEDVAWRTTTDFPDIDPVLPNDAAYWETCFTATPTPAACVTKYEPDIALPGPGDPGALASPPQYVIEEKTVAGVDYFRITARAVGGSPDTIVVLQSEVTF